MSHSDSRHRDLNIMGLLCFIRFVHLTKPVRLQASKPIIWHREAGAANEEGEMQRLRPRILTTPSAPSCIDLLLTQTPPWAVGGVASGVEPDEER